MQKLRDKKGFICDMDGVIYHGNRLVEGTKEFVDWLKRENKKFLFLTKRADLELFPYQPDHVLNCVADIIRGA